MSAIGRSLRLALRSALGILGVSEPPPPVVVNRPLPAALAFQVVGVAPFRMDVA